MTLQYVWLTKPLGSDSVQVKYNYQTMLSESTDAIKILVNVVLA